jgi:hypothetical protein
MPEQTISDTTDMVINITKINSILFHFFNLISVCQANNELIGPTFRLLPPFNVQFSNDTGTKIDCTAFGNPMPQVQWYLGTCLWHINKIVRVTN